MSNHKRYVVLLVNTETGIRSGAIGFSSCGSLYVGALNKPLHWIGQKQFLKRVCAAWEDQPLFIKHKASLNEYGEIPADILLQEAAACARVINAPDPGFGFNGRVRAVVCYNVGEPGRPPVFEPLEGEDPALLGI